MHILTSHDSVWGPSYEKFWPEKFKIAKIGDPLGRGHGVNSAFLRAPQGKTGGSVLNGNRKIAQVLILNCCTDIYLERRP